MADESQTATEDQTPEGQPTEPTPEPQAEPAAPEQQPEAQAKPEPPEYVPYKALSRAVGKKNETIESLQAEIAELKQKVEGGGQPQQGGTANGAQRAIQEAVSPLVGDLKQEIEALKQQQQQYATQQEFNAHRAKVREYIDTHHQEIPDDVKAQAEAMIDQSLQSGQPVDPMIVYRNLYGDYVMRNGQKAREQALSNANQASQANQTAVTAGRPTVSPSPAEDLSGKDVREMSDEEFQQLAEQSGLLEKPLSDF